MDRQDATAHMTTISDYIDDGLEQVGDRFLNNIEELDLDITQMDHNIKEAIVETDTHWEWTVPVKVRIAK